MHMYIIHITWLKTILPLKCVLLSQSSAIIINWKKHVYIIYITEKKQLPRLVPSRFWICLFVCLQRLTIKTLVPDWYVASWCAAPVEVSPPKTTCNKPSRGLNHCSRLGGWVDAQIQCHCTSTSSKLWSGQLEATTTYNNYHQQTYYHHHHHHHHRHHHQLL